MAPLQELGAEAYGCEDGCPAHPLPILDCLLVPVHMWYGFQEVATLGVSWKGEAALGPVSGQLADAWMGIFVSQ